jgi:hypothetical protein
MLKLLVSTVDAWNNDKCISIKWILGVEPPGVEPLRQALFDL